MQITTLFDDYLPQVKKVLRGGGTVIYPAETCYGILANYHDVVAISKVFKIKNRAPEKQLLVIVKNLAEAEKLVDFTPLGKKLADAFWPGALTLVLPKKNQKDETLAIRVPAHTLSRELLEFVDLPLVSTSANLSGEPTNYQFSAVKNLPADLLIDAGNLPHTPPTTIIDACGTTPKILRQGEITEAQISTLL